MQRRLGNKRTVVKILIDALCILSSGILASLILFKDNYIDVFRIVVVYWAIYFLINLISNHVAVSWRYTDSKDVLSLVSVNIASSFFAAIFLFFKASMEIRLVFLLFVLATGFQLFGRLVFRLMRNEASKNKTAPKNNDKRNKTLILGAGEAGAAILRESRANKNFNYKICGFLDDDPKKWFVSINGVKVHGEISEAKKVISKFGIETVIIAIPSLETKKINEIYEEIRDIKCLEIKIIPYFSEILSDKPLSEQMRNINIYDLLGREEQSFDDTNLREFIRGKTIIVTGGAGSIGSELSRQIAKHRPKMLVNIDINENSLYLLELEIKRHYPDIKLVSEICSIRDKKKLREVFKRYMPDIVFHAAAHKHVPLMEHNPEEAIKNNVFGTKNLIDVVDECQVERFVMISTDKAVNPTNIMGATKRACELMVEAKNKVSKTKFMAVRFGNVLGSNGSVIPIFKSLIEEGKNLTVTHEEITRFFMTIPEASRLVLEAGRLGRGGELFILDMGKPVKIIELAKNMIKLSGSNIGIDVIGLRPGEKLYEELLYDVNAAKKTENNKIFITNMTDEKLDIEHYLEKLKLSVELEKKEDIKNVMKEMVNTYKEAVYN